MATVFELTDPLPQRYITDDEGVGGRIKVRPEDFLVDEQPLYEPCGEGEHLYLGIEKHRVAHGEMMAVLARHFGVREQAIGFAGMKDKQGITRQSVSVHLLEDPASVQMSHDRIHVRWAMRHTNKLRRGHLAGNRFSIRVRDVDPLAAPRVQRLLLRLEQTGVPCYFGPQRFGYRRNNHVVGLAMLREQWQEALDELLGARGTPFPEYQRQRREFYDAGRYAEAAEQWTPADRAELGAIKALRDGRSPRAACMAIHRTPSSFWLSAVQSAAFNRVLDRRIADGCFHSFLEGDLAWVHRNRKVFSIDPEALEDPVIAQRLEAREIAPSGPLWGSKMRRPGAAIEAVEREALEALGITLDAFLAARRVPEGARRPLSVPLHSSQVDSGVDEHGPYIRVAFDLPRGSYATVVLREIMKDDQRSDGASEPASDEGGAPAEDDNP